MPKEDNKKTYEVDGKWVFDSEEAFKNWKEHKTESKNGLRNSDGRLTRQPNFIPADENKSDEYDYLYSNSLNDNLDTATSRDDIYGQVDQDEASNDELLIALIAAAAVGAGIFIEKKVVPAFNKKMEETKPDRLKFKINMINKINSIDGLSKIQVLKDISNKKKSQYKKELKQLTKKNNKGSHQKKDQSTAKEKKQKKGKSQKKDQTIKKDTSLVVQNEIKIAPQEDNKPKYRMDQNTFDNINKFISACNYIKDNAEITTEEEYETPKGIDNIIPNLGIEDKTMINALIKNTGQNSNKLVNAEYVLNPDSPIDEDNLIIELEPLKGKL